MSNCKNQAEFSWSVLRVCPAHLEVLQLREKVLKNECNSLKKLGEVNLETD